MAEEKTVFDRLFAIDVNNQVEKKSSGNGKELSYLSWSYAWANVKKRYPTSNYEICKFGEKQTPYIYDEKTGYMVFTKVTIEDVTHEMWLPVMDSHNKAMKDKPYTIKTKYKEITVPAATMFDVNKAIMRCLVKNMAVFGLGLYIYAGEDLPDVADDMTDDERRAEIKKLIQETNTDTVKFLASMGSHFKKEFKSVYEMSGKELEYGLKKIREKKSMMKESEDK